jgi:hypothetical protein
MTALNGAVALVQMHNIAEVVTKQLDLDMLGLVEEALNEDSAVAKRRLGLRSRALKVILERALLADYTHTTATTAERGLDDDREAIFVREGLDVLELLDGAGRTWDDGNVALLSESARRDLVAERVDGLWRGTYPLIFRRRKLYFIQMG